MSKPTGVLIVGFGGPDSLEAVGPFMCNLMGREPSEELIERVRMRYLAIGGASPLNEIAGAMAKALGEELEKSGMPMPVAVGMRYWRPFIDDAMAYLKEQGCERVIVVSLSPFETKVAQQTYREAIERAAAALGGLEIVEAPLISEMPEFSLYMASSAATCLTDIQPAEGMILAFTAHSLPVSDLEEDDPYVAGLRQVADDVADALGLDPGSEDAGSPMFEDFRSYGSAVPPRAWFLVYQSKGQKPGEWLGPDLDELIDACAESGVRGLVVVPIGFATDHLETLYDLDIVAAGRAIALDLEFLRAPVPDESEEMIQGLANAVLRLV